MKSAILAAALAFSLPAAHAAYEPKTLRCEFKDDVKFGVKATQQFTEALKIDHDGPGTSFSATRTVNLSEGALTVSVSAYQPSGPDSYVKHDDIIVNVRDNKTGVSVISGGQGLQGSRADLDAIFVNYGADLPGDSSRVGVKATTQCYLD